MLKPFNIAFLFLFCASLFAQEPMRYTTKQGLPSNHIYDIQEDPNGFMWFATNRGLVKFDGETFKTFTIQDGLPNNDTWLLEIDYQGKMWYFSKSNQQGYIVNDSVYKFYTEDKKVISPRFNFKTKDSLWFFSNGGMQTVKNGRISEVGLYSKVFNEKLIGISKKLGLNNYSTYPNPETKEIVLTSRNGLFFYDWDFNFITKINQQLPSTFNNLKIENRGLLYNQVYFNAFDTGVLFINFNNKTSQYIPFNKYVDAQSVNYFKCKGLKNEIQISIPGHLLVFNYNLELIEKHSFPEVSNNRISYKDSKGNIWLADFIEGITFIPKTQLQTNYYLRGNKIQKLGAIENQLIAGVNEVGFYKYSKANNVLNELELDIANSNGEIYQIKSNPNFLISARKSFIYNNSNLEHINLNFVEGFNKVSQYGFKDIVSFRGENYYITSDYILKEHKIVIKKSGLLQALEFKNKLYFAGSDGLHLLKKDSLIKPNEANDLIGTSILNMFSTKEHLLVGTDGRGVYSYDGKKIFHVKTTDGLSVQRIIKRGNMLWLATQNGVKQISINLDNLETSPIVNSFYESDGLLQNNTNDIYLQDSFLFAASDIGLAKLDVNSKLYKQKPELYFKTKNDTLQFKNEARDNISISFSVQDYSNQENLSYQYRLLPEQEEWVATETKTLNFLHLSPRNYTLEVKAIDQHNNVGNIKQYLNVVPKWWQTLQAQIGFGIIAIGAFLLFISRIKNQIQKKEQQKAIQDKRIAGLELQALRSQMNPHFVHNSLNAIQYFIQRNEVELSENYLVKFSKLIRLFFEYSRRQTITISEEIELLKNYLDIEKLRFEEKLTYSISFDENLGIDEQEIPSMLLQPIVENAVNHGLFHKQGIGNVSISFIKTNINSFQTIVKDDGIGIKEAKYIFKHSSRNYHSNSSNVLQERLELLNQSNEWKIDFKIEDRSDNNKKETGTKVILTFKQIQ